MRRLGRRWLFDVLAVTAAAALLLAWRLWADGGPRRVLEVASIAPPTAATTDATLRNEALELYAVGEFPLACDRFSRAADADPTSLGGRQDVARCFEGWGWQALRSGRPDEARTLFRRGLDATPEDPALLKALGIAAIHDGHSQDALGPLEQAATGDADPEVRLLLARIYDQRDEPERALHHLRELLVRKPGHEAARRLFDKVEREHHVEAGFRRHVTEHFIVKYRGPRDGEASPELLQTLETAYARVGAQLGWRPPEPVTVVVYEDRQFRNVARVHGWVTGLFDGKIRLPLGGALPPASVLDRLVVHEYAHAAIHDLSRGRAPRWLHEGLAQVLEGAIADPLLRVPGRLTLTGLEALVTDPDPLRARAGYDIALWVVQDLVNRGGIPALRQLLERLGGGDGLAAAVARVYGVRLAELESQWRSFLGG